MRRLLYDPQVAKGVWVYFALKITELLDTVSIATFTLILPIQIPLFGNRKIEPQIKFVQKI